MLPFIALSAKFVFLFGLERAVQADRMPPCIPTFRIAICARWYANFRSSVAFSHPVLVVAALIRRRFVSWRLGICFGRYKSTLQSRTKLAREPTIGNQARVYFGCTRAIDMPHVIPPSGGHHVIIVGRARSFSTQIRALCIQRVPAGRS
jgi:hypothetical protein